MSSVLRRWRWRTPFPPRANFRSDYMANAKRGRSRPERLLLVAMYDPQGIATIFEQIDELCALSTFSFDLLNLWGLPSGAGLEIPRGVELERYDGLLVHCTTAYNVANLLSLDRQLRTKIADYRGLKILMKQDEHFRTHAIADYLGSRRFDALVTLVAERDQLRFYPPERAGKLQFIPWLTAYVTEGMRELRTPALALRSIDVGYRGSLQPWYFGTLAFDKCEIGERFRHYGSAHRLVMDISSRWEDRFSGHAWYEFLCRCKATLGVESGASIVDFDGSAEREITAYLNEHPDASFSAAFADVIGKFEGNCQYRTISPRHFEAAAHRCVQVMYEGEYAGIFAADRHYIPLRRDFSNIGTVLDRLQDLDACEEMVDRSFEEIVRDRRYGYAAFVERLDSAIAEALAERKA